jgi:hypothetical protein
MKRLGTPLALLIIIAITSICVVVMSDSIFMDQQTNRYPSVLLSGYSSTGSYKFNPETIFKSLNQEDADIFSPLDAIPEMQEFLIPLMWKQTDYLKITEALHQYVWKETLVNWNIYSMFFDGNCQYTPLGFDIVRITYFKPVGIQQYTARKIDIYPLSGEIDWGGGTTYPRSLFDQWKGMDLKKYEVEVENALQLAEDKGGRNARLAVENECRLHVSLADSGWRVNYSDKNSRVIFEILIDPFTGTYVILK